MDWDWLDTFETLVEIGEDTFYGEDSGFTYEKDFSGQWWVDADGSEMGPFNTVEHACECVAARFGW